MNAASVAVRRTFSAVAVLVAVLPAQPADGPTYESERAAAIARCEAIDAGAYQSGLAFNPAGYRSYYVRSECLQTAAVRFRDRALCERVRQRRALFWSSWGYSPANCRTLVDAATAEDERELAAIRRSARDQGMVLRDVRVERNGNGRDYDLLPRFEGTAGHGYTLIVELAGPTGTPAVVHRNGYFVDPRSALSLFIRQADIKARMPAFEAGRTYRVRVTALFSLPRSDSARFLSVAFLERVFPSRERTQVVTRDVRF